MTTNVAALAIAQNVYASVCDGHNVRLDREDGCVSTVELFDTRSPADAARGVPPKWELVIESTLPSFRGDSGYWGTRLLDGIASIAEASTRATSFFDS
jgi:hypothetical protein